MLAEMTVLVIVLWGSQGMSATTPQEQEFQQLSELYCKAEDLFQKYKSDGDKYLPRQMKSLMESVLSKPGCNFTKPAEECQTLRAFHSLFLWLNSTYSQDGLLKSVMGPFEMLIELQESNACLANASEKVPQISCPKYQSGKPKLQNKIHYIFELYRNHTYNLWHSKVQGKEINVTAMCGAKN